MRRGGWLRWSLYSGGGSLGGRGGPAWWRASTATVARHFRAGRCGVGERERRGCSKVLGGRIVFQRERETRGREEGGQGRESSREREGGARRQQATGAMPCCGYRGRMMFLPKTPCFLFLLFLLFPFLIQWPFWDLIGALKHFTKI